MGGRRKFTRLATPEATFWAHVEKLPNGCWEWQAGRISTGYGGFYLPDGQRVSAHRYSYTLANGAIPAGIFVCHRCDNPPCVNPSHLFLGTPRDNTHDMIAKGRKAQNPTRTHCDRGHPIVRFPSGRLRDCPECSVNEGRADLPTIAAEELAKLNRLDAVVLSRYFGLGRPRRQTMEEIAAVLAVSRFRVAQRKARGLARLGLPNIDTRVRLVAERLLLSA